MAIELAEKEKAKDDSKLEDDEPAEKDEADAQQAPEDESTG